MKNTSLLSLFLTVGLIGSSFGQESAAYFHPASKDAAQDYRRVTTILTANGQLIDSELVEGVEAKLEAYKTDATNPEWADYLYQLQIPDTLKKEGLELLKNLKHNGAHILGDIMLVKKDYQQAIAYYKDALNHPYYSFVPINMVKDEIDIAAKLVRCYENTANLEEVYATGLPRIFGNVKLGKGTILEQQLIRIAAADKAAVKKAIDQGLAQVKSLKVNSNYFGEVVEETFFSFMFNEQKIATLYYGGTAQNFMKDVRETAFYKSLME